MLPVSTKVDLCKGHDACAPRVMATWSPDVMAEGFEVAREEDSLLPHSCKKHPPHGAQISRGHSSVFANGKPIGYVGAALSCPSEEMDTGRPSVLVGNDVTEQASVKAVRGKKLLPDVDTSYEDGTFVLVTDHAEKEGLFINNTDRSLLVVGDRAGTEVIGGTWVAPGGQARGDAILFPDSDGKISSRSRLFKAPNQSTWNAQVVNGKYEVSGAGWGDGIRMSGAKSRNGDDHYEWMDVPQFFRIMHKNQISVQGTNQIIQ